MLSLKQQPGKREREEAQVNAAIPQLPFTD